MKIRKDTFHSSQFYVAKDNSQGFLGLDARYYGWVANFTIVGAGMIFILITAFFLFKTTNYNNNPIDPSIWGQYGDTVGGVVGTAVALVGVFMLYVTLKAQRDIFNTQQIESRFFELVRLHKENVGEMKSRGKHGRAIFVKLKDELVELMDTIQHIYPQNASSNRRENESVAEWKKEIAQIAYLILFYGVNNSSTEVVKERITEITRVRGNSQAVLNYVNRLTDEHQQAKDWNSNIKNPNQDSSKSRKRNLKYDGQQIRLAHYFRHLYHAVKYINNQPNSVISYRQKNEYVRILKAQISTHEQALIFFNSLSDVGSAWELSRDDNNLKLITKYQLIRNMPPQFLKSIDPKNYFPLIQFEHENEMPTGRRGLIREYT